MLGILSRIRRRIENERGVSLIEIILVMVVLGIAVFPLAQLAVMNTNSGGKYVTMTRAIYHAEELMEQIIADYAAVDAGRGYDWVITNWSGQASPNPPAGFTGMVSISAEDSLNGVAYVVVQAKVSGTDIPDVTLATWLVDN